MFTGIIEELGIVKDIKMTGSSGILRIEASEVLKETKIGDSIAVNGVCLTVVSMSESSFLADVMPETVRRSSLSRVRRGDKVNLERAMAANGRFGGHIVSGHIDGMGTIVEYRNEGNAIWVTITADYDIMKFIVEKGSIAIDGISLTVAKVEESFFMVSVIPHTGSKTTLLNKHKGDVVNLENDIVGKYVASFLEQSLLKNGSKEPDKGLTIEMLNDFMK
ncbi:MAG: riboflavin synthase [Lachnospiraceae bacterium]|nr:riboflavin synthase [Lachnospiraceae bacterium]